MKNRSSMLRYSLLVDDGSTAALHQMETPAGRLYPASAFCLQRKYPNRLLSLCYKAAATKKRDFSFLFLGGIVIVSYIILPHFVCVLACAWEPPLHSPAMSSDIGRRPALNSIKRVGLFSSFCSPYFLLASSSSTFYALCVVIVYASAHECHIWTRVKRTWSYPSSFRPSFLFLHIKGLMSMHTPLCVYVCVLFARWLEDMANVSNVGRVINAAKTVSFRLFYRWLHRPTSRSSTLDVCSC